MTHEQFVRACQNTLLILHRGVPFRFTPERDAPGATHTSPQHCVWMLHQAIAFSEAGKVDKANRWLGYVQGVMVALGQATVEELKVANKPEGDLFDPTKI